MFETIDTIITVPASYSLLGPPDSPELIILLHGYGQNKDMFLKSCQAFLPENKQILALNGPFLMPQNNRKGEMVLVFSWYYYSQDRDYFYVPITTAADFVNQVINGLKLDQKSITIVGFSQGGYVIPFLRHKSIVKGIQLHSRCRAEDLIANEIPFPIQAYHGADDKIVDPQRSLNCFQTLLDHGMKGEFTLVPYTGHEFSNELAQLLKTDLS